MKTAAERLEEIKAFQSQFLTESFFDKTPRDAEIVRDFLKTQAEIFPELKK